MTCAELHRTLSLHLDSELSAETAADLARHIESCASCADRVRAEEKLEARLREALRRPAPGDEEAWRKALAILPRRRPRWPFAAAAAAIVAVIAGAFLLTRHRELDLAATMAEHHAKYLEGKSPLEVKSSDPVEASRFFREKLSFPCAIHAPLPADVRLVGGRLCYLDGAPTAFYVFHRNRSPVVVAVFAAADLPRFPVARARLQREGEVHCRVDNMSFVLMGDGTTAISVVGDVSPEDASRIAKLMLARQE